MKKVKKILKIEKINKFFKINQKNIKFLNDIDFSIFEKETLSIIGESGSGKSTLGQIIVQLQKADSGKILYFQNQKSPLNLNKLNKKEINILRQDLQIIFQNSLSTLNPKFKIKDIIGEGLIIQKKVKNKKDPYYSKKIIKIMEQCGLDTVFLNRFPHELSGGQRQRVNIAKTLILKPKFIICDEIVSALDVTIQKQILDLLNYFKHKYKITYLFISHDLGVANFISDRIGVMYKGFLVELASKEEIFNNPLHFYTQKLLQAIPKIKKYSNHNKKYISKSKVEELEKLYTNVNKENQKKFVFQEKKPGHFLLNISKKG
jgi:ABC-type oligopeptide transport system ATPase subunit